MTRTARPSRRASAARVVVAAMCAACAASPKPPPEVLTVEETQEPATAILAREYPNWATDLAPVPGRVVGLLIPAQSKWGRSLESIGESIVTQPGAYSPLGPERIRTYELYAKGVSPRLVYFAVRDPAGLEFRADMAVQTLVGQVRSFPAALFTPKMDNPWGLGAEAHLAEFEISGGEGNARASRFEIVATSVRLLDGQPGYPRAIVEVLDRARETFDQFVKQQEPRVASILAEESSKAADPSGVPAREQASEAIFPYWDEDRRRLSILFYRRVMRVTEYSIPCLFTYEGMPPEQQSMTIRHGYGVELGQKLELDANGALVAVRSFEPASIRLESNAPGFDPSGKGFPPICPGSPGAQGRYHPTLPLPAPPEPAPAAAPGSSQAPSESSHSVHAALEGELAGVAVGHGKVVAVATRGPNLSFRFLEPRSLTPLDDAAGSWALPQQMGHALGLPVIAPVADGFLVAVMTYGTSPLTVVLHLSEAGKVTGPVSTLAGRAVFLVQGSEHALLGVVTERHKRLVEVVRVDAMGKILGAPVAAIVMVPASSYPVASAAFTGNGWLIAAGNGGNPIGPILQYARIGLDGKVLGRGEARTGTGQIAVARGESSTFVVHAGADALFATEISDSGKHSAPRPLAYGLFPRVVAARVQGSILTAWAADVPGRLQRVEFDLRSSATQTRSVIEPPIVPHGASVADGQLYHLYQRVPAGNTPLDRSVWLYRGD